MYTCVIRFALGTNNGILQNDCFINVINTLMINRIFPYCMVLCVNYILPMSLLKTNKQLLSSVYHTFFHSYFIATIADRVIEFMLNYLKHRFWVIKPWQAFNTLRLRQNSPQFPDDKFKCIFSKGNISISTKI